MLRKAYELLKIMIHMPYVNKTLLQSREIVVQYRWHISLIVYTKIYVFLFWSSFNISSWHFIFQTYLIFWKYSVVCDTVIFYCTVLNSWSPVFYILYHHITKDLKSCILWYIWILWKSYTTIHVYSTCVNTSVYLQTKIQCQWSLQVW